MRVIEEGLEDQSLGHPAACLLQALESFQKVGFSTTPTGQHPTTRPDLPTNDNTQQAGVGGHRHSLALILLKGFP